MDLNDLWGGLSPLAPPWIRHCWDTLYLQVVKFWNKLFANDYSWITIFCFYTMIIIRNTMFFCNPGYIVKYSLPLYLYFSTGRLKLWIFIPSTTLQGISFPQLYNSILLYDVWYIFFNMICGASNSIVRINLYQVLEKIRPFFILISKNSRSWQKNLLLHKWILDIQCLSKS